VDDALMTSLGFNIKNNSRDTSTPTGVGNSVYDAVRCRSATTVLAGVVGPMNAFLHRMV
jgi:hypothetical protein